MTFETLIKGRHHLKMKVLIRALPELAKPPPHPPIRAPWSFFSGRQKRRFARMMEITWWKKGPKNSGMGKPPPHFRAMPELKPSF